MKIFNWFKKDKAKFELFGKVEVRDFDEQDWRPAFFGEYRPLGSHPYYCLAKQSDGTYVPCGWVQCRKAEK